MNRLMLLGIAGLLLTVTSHARGGDEKDTGLIAYDIGFYDLERLKDKTWRWMADEGIVKLRNTGRDMILKIGGRVPHDALPATPMMTVILNGAQLEQFTVTKNLTEKEYFEKEYKISAAKLGAGAWSELRLTTSKVVVPKDVDKNSSDERRLGFKMYQLTWEPAFGPALVLEPAPRSGARTWLVVLLTLVTLLPFVLAVVIGAWFHGRKTGAGTEAMLETASYQCEDCARKAREELAGQTVACCQCGKAVLVPRRP